MHRVAGVGHQGWASLWVHLMSGAGQLAEFLGPEQATSTLLPTFMWLPNESDWRVRAAFYQHLPGVAQGLVCFTVCGTCGALLHHTTECTVS